MAVVRKIREDEPPKLEEVAAAIQRRMHGKSGSVTLHFLRGRFETVTWGDREDSRSLVNRGGVSTETMPVFTPESPIPFTLTEPGTRGVLTLSDGSEVVVTEGGKVTNECLNYVIGPKPGEPGPATGVRYVGPQLYT
jgi:hypothetical protein